MYINFNKLLSKNFSPHDLLFLQAVHQQRGDSELESVVAMLATDDSLDKMVEGGYITQIKGKKGDSEIAKLRTTKKGRTLLLDLQKSEEWEENDDILGEWLEGIYKKRPDYIKSNMAELKRRLFWFRYETGIHGNELAILLKTYIENVYIEDRSDKRSFTEKFYEFKADNPMAQISNIPANILWKPKDHFQRHMTLEQSNLWSFYQEHQNYIEKLWKRVEN